LAFHAAEAYVGDQKDEEGGEEGGEKESYDSAVAGFIECESS
jgi:hypothetical protein